MMRFLNGLELSVETKLPSQASKEGRSVLPLLEAMAEQHPQALYYQFKISSETLKDSQVPPERFGFILDTYQMFFLI